MDAFSKRLRKQHERSSLHARQLNKNAMALLHKQLSMLERRKQENARVLTRSRQAILQELTDAQPPEHEGLERRGDRDSRRRPTVSMVVFETGLERPRSVPHSSSPELNHHWDFGDGPHAELECAHSPNSSCSSLHLSQSFSRHYGKKVKQNLCRFQACPLDPCPYFPCKRPDSYHHLKVSDVPDIAPLRLDQEKVQPKTPVTAPQSVHSSPGSDPFSSLSRPASDGTGRASRASTASSSKGLHYADGHVSPRNSINERLRGLRQLGRELRLKNDAKRPRDWVVNYGDPMSRRLLRKPAIPVSDE